MPKSILLHRKIQENYLWKISRVYSEAEAWLELLMLATPVKRNIIVKGEKYLCNRAQYPHILSLLRKRWGWTRPRVIRFINKLATLKKINLEIKDNTKVVTMLITILDYDNFVLKSKYQDKPALNERYEYFDSIYIEKNFLESDVWKKLRPKEHRKRYSKAEAWINMLFMTNGASINSSDLSLANKWGWSKTKVARYIHELRDEEMVSIDGQRRTITINNFLIYQGERTRELHGEKIKSLPSKKPDKKPKATIKKIDYKWYEETWNKFAEKNELSSIITIDNSRKRRIAIRSKEKYFDFKKILEAIEEQPFLFGKSGNDAWRINFDFIINSPKGYLKILEKGYASSGRKKGKVYKEENLKTNW